MSLPKKNKFAKVRKGHLCGFENKTTFLVVGNFGIKCISSAKIRVCHFESIRKFLMKNLKKTDKFWFRIHPFLAVTSKPVETRMGRGKGSLSYYCFPLKAGRIIFEFQHISTKFATKLNSSLKSKLPVQIRLIKTYN